MVQIQLDIELFPIVVGFSCGITIYILSWIFPSKRGVNKGASAGTETKGKQEEVSEEPTCPAPSEPSAEPLAEPGPEPADAEAPEPRQRAATPRQPVPGYALLVLFGLLCALKAGLSLQDGGLTIPPSVARYSPWALAPQDEVPPEVAAQAEVLSAEPEQPPMEEEAEPANATVPLEADDFEVQSMEAQLLEPENAAVPLEADDFEAAAVEPEEEESGNQAGVEASEEPANAQLITLNLTRQTMAIQNIGDIIHYKSAYWGTIAVGTPAVDYKVVFDTGSGYLILPSTYCHSETCRAHKRYRRPASVTARDIDFDGTEVVAGDPRDEMTISFGTGEVTGVLVDDITCADDRNVALGMPLEGCMPMSMIIATDMTEEPFRTFHFDGVLGLGLVGLTKSNSFSFIHNIGKTVHERGGSTPNIFSVFLGQHKREASDITFGGYVADHLEDTISWNSVLHPELGHWMLRVKALRVDDEVVSFCNEGCRAIVDTGTSLLAVPTPVFPEIHELLRHEADPLLECQGPGPKLHIELEGLTLTLEPQDYAKSETALFGSPPTSRVRYPLSNTTHEFEPEYCKPTLMSMELPEPVGPKLFVLGEPVLRKYYTVFDFTEDAPRIGFGKALHRKMAPPAALAAQDPLDDEEDDAWR
uniref:Peptidase A1 domain-containing protein n=1 Tax=Alexandrium catenella TaxID=2925 RepID=A0A7S1S4V5_ALECA